MRKLIFIIVLGSLAACTPDIVPGSYFCGPNAACPEDQKCNFADNTCVLPGVVAAFACEADINSEPDDSIDQGYAITSTDCSTLPVVIDNCMSPNDDSDWVRLTIPAQCSTMGIDARITFPVAFEELQLEVVDAATSATLATESACPVQGESGDDLRCVKANLAPGKTYGLHVSPTGDGVCDGECRFNRYTLRLQLGPPG